MSIGLDLSHITPEDIKEATAALNKEISAQVNDAMKKGLTGSLKKYSQVISESVSSGLKSSLTQTFKKDISREFADLFSSRSFIDNVSKGLKVAIADAFKTMPTMKVDVQPVLAPGGMPALPSTGATSASAGTGIDASQLQGKISDSGMEVVSVQALMAGAYRKLIDSSELLNASLKDVNDQFKSLTDKEKERFEIAEKEVKGKKHKEVDPDTNSKKDKEKGLFGGKIDIGRAFNMFVGGILTKALLGKVSITKDAFKGYFNRQQDSLQSAGTALPSGALLKNPQMAIDMVKGLKEAMKTDPILATFGGGKGAEAFLSLQRAKGTKDDANLNTEEAVVAMKKLTASAMLSGMTLEEFAKKVEGNIYAYGMAEKASTDFVEGMAQRAKDIRVPFDSLKGFLDSANGSLRLWGHGLSETYGIASRFGRQLEQSTVSMGDIITFAGGLHKTGEGESVFMNQMMASDKTNIGNEIAVAIERVSKNNPISAADIRKRVAEGTPGIARELGLSGTDQSLQSVYRAGSLQMAKKRASDLGGDDKYAVSYLLNKFLAEQGMSTEGMSIKNRDELLASNLTKNKNGTYGAQDWASPGKEKSVVGADGKAGIDRLTEAMGSSIGPIAEAKMKIEHATILFSDAVGDIFQPSKGVFRMREISQSLLNASSQGVAGKASKGAEVLANYSIPFAQSDKNVIIADTLVKLGKQMESSVSSKQVGKSQTQVEAFFILMGDGKGFEAIKGDLEDVQNNKANRETTRRIVEFASDYAKSVKEKSAATQGTVE